ncbi:DUF4157 domain-containing protein, partial [Micromonospora sp. CPCC 205371]|nr:DUF4157 domain-containing protein [Micromonospora sp. CPCC 205371]
MVVSGPPERESPASVAATPGRQPPALRQDDQRGPPQPTLGPLAAAGNAAISRLLGGAPPAGGGAALPAGFRAEAEASFGAGLSGVRVHTDAAADGAARRVSANAFTVGSDIYFGAGRYDPDGSTGRHLLAHELTHVVQQAPGPVAAQASPARLSDPGDAAERA